MGLGLPLVQGKGDLEHRQTIDRVWTTRAPKQCDAGDLLLTVRAPVGSVAVATRNSCVGRGICALKPVGNSAFLYHALVFAETAWQSFEQGSTFGAANSTHIESFRVLVPHDVREQRAIAEVLSDMDRLVDSLEALIAKKRTVRTATMHQLFSGKNRLPGFCEGWDGVRLGDVGSTYGGLSGKKGEDFGHGTGRYLTFLSILENVVVGGRGTGQVRIAATEGQNLTRKGDVLFNGTSETAEDLALGAAVSESAEALYLNSFCFGFRVREPGRFLPVFLAYFFRSPAGRKAVRKLAQGATRYNLSTRQFLSLIVRLPKAEEQRAISLTIRDMDTEIEALEQRRDKTRALKQGMMQQLLTGRTRLVESGATAKRAAGAPSPARAERRHNA